MKNILLMFNITLFSLISTPVFAETYFCSHELTRYNRPGEVESKIMKSNLLVNLA